MNPKISIITPLHNKGRYIAETIESVLSQSFADWEMLVVENGSKDHGPGIVREFTLRDSRIRLIEAPPNVRGPGAARNLGLKEARGTWIQFLDADDLLLPVHFKSQLEAIVENPRADVVTCDWLEGAMPDQAKRKTPTNARSGDSWRDSAIAFTPWVVHSAWVKRTALGNPPWWDESMDGMVMEDHVFWFKLLLSAQAIYSRHVGVFYRIDTAFRRHDDKDLNKYIGSLEVAVARNFQILKMAGKDLSYKHRKALMNLYLGLLRFDFSADSRHFQSLIIERIREFRPFFQDAAINKDVSSLLSYVLPAGVLHKLLVARRSRV